MMTSSSEQIDEIVEPMALKCPATLADGRSRTGPRLAVAAFILPLAFLLTTNSLFAQERYFVRAGSRDNQLPITVRNRHDVLPMNRVQVAVPRAPTLLTNLRVEPGVIDVLPPRGSQELILHFDVPSGAEPGQQEELSLGLSSETDLSFDPQVTVTIAITDRSVVEVCALTEATPLEVEDADAGDFCDADIERVLHYDRRALFLTPSRHVPAEGPGGFAYRVLDPDGDVLWRGQFANEQQSPRLSIARAKEGSPGKFVTLLSPRFFDIRRDTPPQTTGPQNYRVESSSIKMEPTGVLGQGELRPVPVGDWEEEGSFELWDARLYFQGFVAEEIREKPLPLGFENGTLSVSDPLVAGTKVTLDLLAEWAGGGAGRRTAARLQLQFPEALNPGYTEMGALQVDFRHSESGKGPNYYPIYFVAGANLLVPINEVPPERRLVTGAAIPKAWAAGDRSGVRSERASGNGQFAWPQDREPDLLASLPTEYRGVLHLRRGSPRDQFGSPPRLLPAHLHDQDTIWVIPVFYHLSVETASNYIREPIVRNWGYAVYAPLPGVYDGPSPLGDPGPPRPPARLLSERQLPSVVGMSVQEAQTLLAGREFEIRLSAAGDAPDPALSSTVASQNPGPGSVPAGTAVELSVYGEYVPPLTAVPNVVGQAYAEARQAVEAAGLTLEQPVSAGPAPAQYLSSTVASQNPGPGSVPAGMAVELSVYGEYVPPLTAVPNVVGQAYAEARQAVEAAGLTLEQPVSAGPAPAQYLSSTVASQNPGPGSVPAGMAVELSVYGEYVPPLTAVPNVVGQAYAEARQAVEAAGLTLEQLVSAGPAPAQYLSSTVASQNPGPGSVPAGTAVELSVYGEYVPPLTAVPNVVGQAYAEARQAVEAAGLTLEQPVSAGPAPAQYLSSTVASQNPGPGSVPAGMAVELSVYGEYVPPLTAVPNVVGQAYAEARQAVEAAGLTLEQPVSAGPAPAQYLSSTVASQNPGPGSVPAGTAVELSVYGEYVPPLTAVPNVVGYTLAGAQAALSRLGLEGNVENVAARSPREAGRVTAQFPNAGSRVTSGSIVAISVAGSFVDLVIVPDLRGLSVTNARVQLQRIGLVAEGDSVASENSVVSSHSPPAGARVERSSRVRLDFPAVTRVVPPVPPQPRRRQWRRLQPELASSPPDQRRRGGNVSITSYSVSEEQVSCQFRVWYPENTIRKDVEWQVRFARPPQVIQEGETLEFHLEGSLVSRAGNFAEQWGVHVQVEGMVDGPSETLRLTSALVGQRITATLRFTPDQRTPENFVVRVSGGLLSRRQIGFSVQWRYRQDSGQ